MAEHAIPLNELAEVMGEKSIDFANMDVSETLPRVDAMRGVFITSRGTEIELSDNPVSSLIVQRLQTAGKPKIPMIETTILGRKQSEPYPGHEGYQARLKEWEEESQTALVQYLFVVGTKGKPPQEFIDEQSPYFPGATESDMKYLWIASRLPDDDMGAFTEAVMGKTLTTAKGLDESAETFRSES